MNWKHEGIIFDEREIGASREKLDQQPQRAASRQLVVKAGLALGYQSNPIEGVLEVPGFYSDREGRNKAVADFERSAQAMISCSNMFRLTGETEYRDKVIEIADSWTGKITGYGTPQAQYEANWNLQAMAVACELTGGHNVEELSKFLEWDREQCWQLEDLNEKNNNLFYWLGAHMITAGIANEDVGLFERACDIYKTAISENISDNGEMPKETIRGKRGIHYTFFAIDALVFIAEAARHQGADLFSYHVDGKSLQKAIQYILPFAENPDAWPHSQEPQDFTAFPYNHSGWCEVAYRELNLPELKTFLDKYRPLFDHRSGGAQTLFHGAVES